MRPPSRWESTADRLQKLDQEKRLADTPNAIGKHPAAELASAVDRWAPLVLAETMMNR